MSFNFIVISNASQLEYSIGFPVLEKDLAVFRNGSKLNDYTFKQSTNSIVMKPGRLAVGDTLMFRIVKDL